MKEQTNIDSNVSISDFFSNNPTIQKGLDLIGIKHPTYLQTSILSSKSTADNVSLVAPAGSGKVLGALLFVLRRILEKENGHLLILVPSKQLSIKCSTLINQLLRLQSINLWINNSSTVESKSIIIGSPAQAQNLPKNVKDQTSHSIIIEFDMLIWMGYWQHLRRLYDSLHCSIFVTANSGCPQLHEFKKTYMKKVLNIQVDNNEENDEVQKEDSQINHFFYVGQNYGLYSALYITLKFGMTHPKTIILCKDTKQVYRTYLFLERSQIKSIGLYNPDNPIDVKFYSLSLWLTGHTNILIASPQLFKDIESNIFKPNCLKTYKKSTIQMRCLSSIITINLDYIQDYSCLFQNFGGKSLIITLVEQKQTQSLNSLFEFQKNNYSNVKLRNFPITNLQVQGFIYRVKDLVSHLGNKRVQWFMQIDLKKKLIKSKDLAQYFSKKPEQKQLLVKQINELTSKLNYGRIQLSNQVPPYLVPQILREAYNKKVEQQIKTEIKKPIQSISQKIKKVVAGIDEDDENPDVTDVSRLKLISNRKRWKLRHGFKLRKRNIRNEKKGIYQS